MSEVKVDTISERTTDAGVTVEGVKIEDGIATFQTAAGSPLVFEGATADAFETTFAITDPTADRTITFPDSSFTVPTTGGKVLQVVQTVKTDTTSTTAWESTALVDIAGMTVDITPSATTSKVLVFWNLSLNSVANMRQYIRLAQVVSSVETYPLIGDAASSRARVTSTASPTNSQGQVNTSVQYLASPATTSTVTYKLQWTSATAGTTYLNRSSDDTDSDPFSRTTSSIMVMEIGA